MSAVEVEITEEPESEAPEPEEEAPKRRRSQRKGRDSVDVEIEREVTKREMIQSVTTIVVVVLYMVFTLLRDREAGVVIIDPEGPEDDWED